MTHKTILVVEDDRHLKHALVSTLETAGFAVLSANDGSQALDIVARSEVDLVVTDVQMSPVDGRALLRSLQAQRPALPVLMMTAYGTIEQAVGAMRDGAVDYLVKPFEAEELQLRVVRHLQPEGGKPAQRGKDAPVAADPRTTALLELAQKVAASEVTVLLTGESGTGKEVFARFIHRRSKRAANPFVAVNCAAIPAPMLEALLFGHEKGSFTGAQSRSDGKFVQANGGTLLLDEITEMELGLQAKLLRVLQEREVEPLGARAPVPLDVRVLATSNRDLEQTVREGRFREDLYYRLSVFPLEIPPLRQRPRDVAPLASRFVSRHSGGRTPAVLSPATLEILERYGWPGNVRELENVIQRAIVLADGGSVIEPRHLILDSARAAGGAAPTASGPLADEPAHPAADGRHAAAAALGLADELWEEETRRIVGALQASFGSRKRAAAQLGISGRTLRYKLAKIRAAGIEVPGDRYS